MDNAGFFLFPCRNDPEFRGHAVSAGKGAGRIATVNENCKEGDMAIKVLIKRKVSESREKELGGLLRQLRSLTMNRAGYISGETLKRVDKPGENLVISTWQSPDDWREWVLSRERAEIQDRIDTLLGEKTEYEIYTY